MHYNVLKMVLLVEVVVVALMTVLVVVVMDNVKRCQWRAET